MQEKYDKALDKILRKLSQYSQNIETELVRTIFKFSYEAHKEQLRKSGKPYFEHPLEVAQILTELKMEKE